MAVKITDETYQEFTSTGVSMVDVWAPWCGPCKAIGPFIEELSTEYSNVRIGKLNADENPETLQKLGIRNIPTVLVYKNGSIVEKHVGLGTKEQFKSLIDKHLN